MINVDILNIFEDSIRRIIDNDIYCICYDDGKDKRLMINYGLFQTKDSCIDYINSINNSNLIAYPIKINKKERRDFLIYEIQDDIDYLYNCLQYFHKMELIVANKILQEIETLLQETTMNGNEILDFILNKYRPLTEEDLINLIPSEYNKLILM